MPWNSFLCAFWIADYWAVSSIIGTWLVNDAPGGCLRLAQLVPLRLDTRTIVRSSILEGALAMIDFSSVDYGPDSMLASRP